MGACDFLRWEVDAYIQDAKKKHDQGYSETIRVPNNSSTLERVGMYLLRPRLVTQLRLQTLGYALQAGRGGDTVLVRRPERDQLGNLGETSTEMTRATVMNRTTARQLSGVFFAFTSIAIRLHVNLAATN